MRVKVSNKNANINIFGGIYPVLQQINNLGIANIIEQVLGSRPKQSKYSNSEVIIFWMLSQFCGIDKLDRVWKTAKNFKDIPDLKNKIPSHDTINRLMKYYAVPTRIYSDDDIRNEVNYNTKMNKLLNQVLKATNLLDKKKTHTLDIDTIVIPTEVKDARFSYKMFRGYNPCVSVIDNIPVNLEMRNGNVSPKYKLVEHLKNTFKHLTEIGVNVDKVRIDGAGYNHKILTYLDSLGKKFYIRANRSEKKYYMVNKDEKWRPVSIPISNGKLKGEIISIEEIFSEYKKMVRIITTRHKIKNPKDNEYPYIYRSIITNDFTSKPEDIVRFYNLRAKEEKTFDDLRNNFGWKYPPFSDMANNTVFYLISMITCVIYKYIIKKFSKLDEKLEPTMVLRTFATIFITVAAQIFAKNNYLDLVFLSDDFEFKDFMK